MDYRAIATWALGSTGASSKCLARHLMGLECDGSYPHDGGDFGRCEALLEAVPEFRTRLMEMASVNKYWAALAPKWDEIKSAKDQYDAIQKIVQPVEAADPRVMRLGKGARVRF